VFTSEELIPANINRVKTRSITKPEGKMPKISIKGVRINSIRLALRIAYFLFFK